MRIIAGTLKGRRLASPTWEGLRPTSDRLRETLFNILAGRVEGARVLDVYAGTGAIGIEALSRGAAHVTFVEADGRAQSLILDNIARCGVTDGYAMLRNDALRALEALREEGRRFDFVLLDPPYNGNRKSRGARPVGATVDVLLAVDAVLTDGGTVVWEHAERTAMPPAVGGLARVRVVESGDSALTFYHREL